MGCQHHVAAAVQHPELVGQRTWGPALVELGDDVEDHLAGSGHIDQLWAERSDPPADAQVDRAGAGDEPDIAGRGHPGARSRSRAAEGWDGSWTASLAPTADRSATLGSLWRIV